MIISPEKIIQTSFNSSHYGKIRNGYYYPALKDRLTIAIDRKISLLKAIPNCPLLFQACKSLQGWPPADPVAGITPILWAAILVPCGCFRDHDHVFTPSDPL